MSDEHRKPKSNPLPRTVLVRNGRPVLPDDQRDLTVRANSPDRLERLGRYELRSEIARGGMGIIVKAYDDMLHREVAVKMLRPEYLKLPSLYERFVNEAFLSSQLQHPCIVPIYDLGQTSNDLPYFAMKLITGQSLSELLQVPLESQIDRSRLLKIFEQVCLTLAYTHSLGVLHLDVKPANIMVGKFGEVHVMDWGLARLWQPEMESVQRVDGPPGQLRFQRVPGAPGLTNGISGTPAYMAPEQARGELVDTRSDVFGLGALLCEILTGRPAYQGRSYQRVFTRALQGKLDDALDRLDACHRDRQLIALAKQCLAIDPQRRPADATEVARVISDYLEFALEQAESDLCRFFDLSLDLFCIASLDGYFLRINKNFPRVLGYTEDRLISEPFLEFVHPDDVHKTQTVMQVLLAGKPVVQFCNRYRHAAGHYIVLEWTAQSILKEGTIFAVRDVTSGAQTKAAQAEDLG